MESAKREIPLSEAALRLRKSWAQCWRLLLKNEISGRKVDGRWVCDVESVDAWLQRQ